ncbi:MAG: alanine racemase [Gammaproteobacteria bacterium]|nr:alanine racemase [Gammaproteobacteria bacterium]
MPNSRFDDHWRAQAVIDLHSLYHNIRQVRLKAPNSRLMAVVKADAYGHGLENICTAAAAQVDGFAVATLQEGIICRALQPEKPIIVLSEFWHAGQLRDFERCDMQPVVHTPSQVACLAGYTGRPLSIWIKCDSGMNRLGIPMESLKEVYETLLSRKTVRRIRIMSHLANADIPGDEFTHHQLGVFRGHSRFARCERSLANTAGVMRWPQTHFDWVRPGLMLYGVSPFGREPDARVPLKPVMQLKARIISEKTVKRGQPVGYGGLYRTTRKTRVAMVGLGYGDGYPRVVDDRACVLVKHSRAPIIGRISMDMITIDLTELGRVGIGDEVVLWGPGLPVEEVADWAGTIPYELLCKVTPRIPRTIRTE